MFSKLFNLIGQLTLPEHRELTHFLKMNSHRLSDRDREIFAGLSKRRKTLHEEREEDVWSALLAPEEVRDRNRIKNRLLKAVERYLGLVVMERDHEAYRAYALGRYYLQREIPKNAVTHLSNGTRIAGNHPTFRHRIYDYHLHELQLNVNKNQRERDETLAKMAAGLEEFYAGGRLRIICEMVNRGPILGHDVPQGLHRPEVEDLLKRSDSPHVRVYAHVYELLDYQSHAAFAEIENYLSAYPELLPADTIKELYTYLLNFCARALNHGEVDFARKYLHLFETLENKDLLLEYGTISTPRLQNLIAAALMVDEQHRAEAKLAAYAAKLSRYGQVQPEDFVALNTALLKLHAGDAEGAQNDAYSFWGSELYDKDIYFRLACDKILLKSAFTLRQTEIFESTLRRVRYYLKQERLPAQRTRKHYAFLSMISRARKGKMTDDPKWRSRLLILDYLWYRKFVI